MLFTAVTMYVVGSWMTKDPVTLRETDDLATANGLFKLGRMRHLPVVRKGRLVGLLSTRDLLRALGARPKKGEALAPVKAVMRKKLFTARTTTPLREAARVMLSKKIGCLPVVGTGGKLLGIVTESDLVRLAAEVLDDVDRMDAVVESVVGARR